MITETAATEVGGLKAEWIEHMIEEFATNDQISGFIWFNVNKETNWRIDSSEETQAAFRTAIDRPEFGFGS